MLQEGQSAPDFKVKNHEDREVSLKDFKGKNVVLYFYPKDNTSGCTKEACGFRDLQTDFDKVNTVILGVSPDGVKSHRNFISKYALPFPLLSDVDKELVQLYDVWKEKSMYGRKYMGVVRTTYVIDREGIIRKIYPKVKVTEHPEAVLELVKELEIANENIKMQNYFSETCPGEGSKKGE